MNTGKNANISQDINRLLKRGVAEIIIEEELAELLRSGKKLRLKEGFDPSFPDIHLGHMVALRKLRQFQNLGHQVILIVGDWTAQIGDPSGASAARPMLSKEQVKANAETYMKQFFKVVDKNRTEVKWQSEWFGKFTLTDIIQLTSKFTVAQLLAREDFSARYNSGRPIAVTELLYPLLQAYDSVEIQADVEFGGTDQKFNFLMGRELQSMAGQRPQQCFMTPLLVGTTGSQKMSKSLGNYIGVAEPPNDIYGKTMSIADSLILDYFELLTDVPDKDLGEFRQGLKNETINPMMLKKRLARELVTQLYDQKKANEAEEQFTRVFQRREMPEEIPEYRVSFDQFKAVELSGFGRKNPYTIKGINVNRLLVGVNLAESRSEADRLISQGAVSIDGRVISSSTMLYYNIESGSIIKVGKRRWAKVINTDK
ncbi:MAG: tyrosine--tRNA ligase [Dehalococcoidales bacterium]|nr:tyrosine--tRNA ligase [Dehalococcoidales bacterium]